ncbi:unnamed protein product [Acanthoscelides obtectus]|uniref:Uncharacterized protein n=1 Tax=Acanthoscelides obtectus TaxID=200917 RepID=A0A9P0JNC5_ACAOB|nr:unnamed protein product [Acanthoscelides obtectus]CAK1661106.1 hypothetical protein AOBTE_LOCUS22442 [Acanthoscelides obtectus]
MNSKVRNKVLSQQCREIIASVLEFMQKEATDGVTIPIDKVQECVSAATGVSLSSIRRVKKEVRNIKEHVAVSFPKPKRTNIKTKVALDGFDQGLLRRTIINYHITEKRIPTLRCIHRKMRDVAN